MTARERPAFVGSLNTTRCVQVSNLQGGTSQRLQGDSSYTNEQGRYRHKTMFPSSAASPVRVLLHTVYETLSGSLREPFLLVW
ncbi:hypothetical protein PBY51_006386 [Eleginops maclovinus]|uniref:Uncharacterized protein n=1 Tax=Eleginops maclovinus TaxID=56733 RepID=A0AAN8AEP6_ELEMC|nr:hypothetical protein PBY51_006386 [Eleginops maclovinus]